MINLSSLTLNCEYQPFVAPHTLAIDGYEALARFYLPNGDAVAPNIVFEQLHESTELLAAVEYQAKAFQLAHAPSQPAAHFYQCRSPRCRWATYYQAYKAAIAVPASHGRDH